MNDEITARLRLVFLDKFAVKSINNILVKIVVEMFGGFAEILYLCKQERQESPDLDFV